MNEKDIKLILDIFDSLESLPYKQLNTFLGSQTIKDMHDLHERLGNQNNEPIRQATFSSVWDNGMVVTTKCMVNTKTRQIFDIEPSEEITIHNSAELIREYVTVDGIEIPAWSADTDDEDWNEAVDYWYK